MAMENIIPWPVATTAGGTFTGFLSNIQVVPFGKLRKVRYVPATPNFTDSATATFTGAVSGQNMLAATVTTGATAQEWSPQNAGSKSTDGTASTTYVDVPVGEDIKLVIASGGATKKGTFYLWIGD